MKDAKVAEKDAFWMKGGIKIRNLQELLDALHEIEFPAFQYHVSKGKNDFAIWIRKHYGNKELAKQIEKVRTPEEMDKIIESHLKKKGIILHRKVKRKHIRHRRDRTVEIAGMAVLIAVGAAAIVVMILGRM